jgi:hypothetical protein
MITLGDRVRAAAEATAQEITPDSIPDWPDFAVLAGSGRERRAPTTRRHFRVLAPVAAAVAVAVVIALAAGISARTRSAGNTGASSAAGVSLSCTRPDSLCVPRYYLDLTGVIRDRITGAVITTIRLPRPYRAIDAIAGAADDRTFVVAAQTEKGYGPYPVRLFLARFNPADGSATVSALPIPAIGPAPLLTGLALSPDGRQLATAVLNGPDRNDSLVSVYSLTGGRTLGPVKSWQGSGTIGLSPYDSGSISWSGGGTLAINWEAARSSNLQLPTEAVLLLDTTAPSGGLLAHSRFLLNSEPADPADPGLAGDGLLTPDGTKVVAVTTTIRPIRAGQHLAPRLWTEIEEFSAQTGDPVGYVHRITASSPDETLEWTNSTGSALVVAAPPRAGRPAVFGVLIGNRFYSIPGAPTPVPSPSIATIAF